MPPFGDDPPRRPRRPPEGIRITSREVYDLLQQVRDEVLATRGQISALQAEAKANAERVRSLELRWYGILAGILAAVGAVIYQGVSH